MTTWGYVVYLKVYSSIVIRRQDHAKIDKKLIECTLEGLRVDFPNIACLSPSAVIGFF